MLGLANRLGGPSAHVHDAATLGAVPLVQLGRCAGNTELPVIFGAVKRRLIAGELGRHSDGRWRPALSALDRAHDAVAELGRRRLRR